MPNCADAFYADAARRPDLTAPDGGWEGLLLEPGRPGRPELRVEVASGRGLTILQSGEPVLLARVDGDYYGVDYVRIADGIPRDAHPLGLLRTVGPIYQFRHTDL